MEYSLEWYKTFSLSYFDSEIQREVNFLTSILPLPQYRDILDIACATGRLCKPLSKKGYNVTGIDINKQAIEIARDRDPITEYLHYDMKHVDKLPGSYDGVLIIWFSFGFFTDDDNIAILRKISRKLRKGGRLILDIHNKKFYDNQQHQPQRELQWNDNIILEKTNYENGHLDVCLTYEEGSMERYSWKLYSQSSLQQICEPLKFIPKLIVQNFDKSQPFTGEGKRYQIVFEKQ